MIRSFALLAASASLAIAPVAAQAAPDRLPAPVTEESEALSGGSWAVPAVIFVGLAIVIWLAIDSEEDIDVPFSP